MRKKHYQLIPHLNSNHLMTSFRVDLWIDNCQQLKESAILQFLEAKDNKIKVKIWHIRYTLNGVGNPTKYSHKTYLIDLNLSYNNKKIIKRIKYRRNGFISLPPNSSWVRDFLNKIHKTTE